MSQLDMSKTNVIVASNLQQSHETIRDVTCPDCGITRQECVRNFQSGSFEVAKLQSIYSAADLRPWSHDIRILTLLAGSFDEPVRCRLSTVCLANEPEFVALSYCWGDENDRGIVDVNGTAVSVTRSLQLALKYMRDQKDHIQVWADAICINQLDDDEKSVQVRMMGEIFSNGIE